MNYNDLVTDITRYLQREDVVVTQEIPLFITLGVNRIYSDCPTINSQEVLTDSFTPGINTFRKPLDWKQTVHFQFVIPGIAPYAEFLRPVGYEFARLYWRNPDLRAIPKFYSELDENFLFISPTPDAAYNIIFTYLSSPILNANNPENFLTRRYYELILNASLISAERYLKNTEMVPQWQASYQTALDALKKDTVSHYTDRTVKRDVN